MGVINSNASYSGLVEKYIGTAYDNVKLVADNIADVNAVAALYGDGAPGVWNFHTRLNTVGGQFLGEISDIPATANGLRFVFEVTDPNFLIVKLGSSAIYSTDVEGSTILQPTGTLASWATAAAIPAMLLTADAISAETVFGTAEIFRDGLSNTWIGNGDTTLTAIEQHTSQGKITLTNPLTNIQIGGDTAVVIGAGSYCDVYVMVSE